MGRWHEEGECTAEVLLVVCIVNVTMLLVVNTSC